MHVRDLDETGAHVLSEGYLEANGILAVVTAVARDVAEHVAVLRLP